MKGILRSEKFVCKSSIWDLKIMQKKLGEKSKNDTNFNTWE